MTDSPCSHGHDGTANPPSKADSSADEESDATCARERSVSIIIPTYNERENIERVVERCRAALSEYRFEIVVVDDNSPDKTWQFVEETYADVETVRIVRRTEESGLATAVSRGFDEASYEYCAVIDADLQHPPEKLPELIAAFDTGADIVIGSRHVPGGGVENWSPLRRVVSHGAMAIAKLALPPTRGIADPMSGFFAIRHEVIDGVILSRSVTKYFSNCSWSVNPYGLSKRPTRSPAENAERQTSLLRSTSNFSSTLSPFVGGGRRPENRNEHS